MPPPSSPKPPGPAVAAALLGLVSASFPVLAVLLVLVMAAGDVDAAFALSLLPPLGMSAWLAGGAVLLLLGRSWRGLALPAAVLAVLALYGLVIGGLGGPFVLGAFLVALATAVLAALPGVRHWVAERRRLRAVLPTGSAS